MTFSKDQQEKLLTLARESIESIFSNQNFDSEDYKAEFSQELGVFVTLNIGGKLRGCIGYDEGYYPLYEGIFKAATSAAFHDSRFNPLTKEEFSKISIEISILGELEEIQVSNYTEYLDQIELGIDGISIEAGPSTAIFLPMVPRNQGWTVEEFLENLCLKASLSKDEWKEPATKLFKFQTQTFEE